jgi:ATP-dependent DNA helicase RecG
MLVDYKHIIFQGESETVEFKKSTSLLREAIETICAFANTSGGVLFFGVSDNGNILGQQVTDDTLRTIANSVALNTEPKLYPAVNKTEIEGKFCVVVTIEESPLKPHLAYGRPYIRVGTTTQRTDRNYYEMLLMQRYNGYGFDFLIQKNAELTDIDVDSVYEFLDAANANRNLNVSLVSPINEVLHKLDLMTGEGITNAAILLFGKEPAKFFDFHFEIKAGVFDADEQYDHIQNEQQFSGNLFYNYKQALLLLLNSIAKEATKIQGHTVESYEIPVDVLKEALVNMIVHRDYRQGIKSTIEIRPSFISFYNPGHLFTPSITIEGLKRSHPSRPGNKLLSKIFYLAGLFENWGGGTLKIITECNKIGLIEPIFSFEGGMFRLTISRGKFKIGEQ